MNTMKNKIGGEIEWATIERLLDQLNGCKELEKPGHSLFILGKGDKTRGFYDDLKDNPDIDLIWTGWFGPKWMRILSFIPAQAGLLKLKNINSLKDIYLQVGELSFCSIYFLRDEKGMELIDGIRKDNYRVNVDSILMDDTDYFILEVDFDYLGGERDRDVIFRLVQIGSGISNALKQILLADDMKS